MTEKEAEEFTEKPIPRSRKEIPQTDFMKWLQLVQQRRWLETKQDALSELIEICEGDIEKIDLIVTLLYKFTYLSEQEYRQCLEEIAIKIIREWRLEPTNTFILPCNIGDEIDGSHQVIQGLKNCFNDKVEAKFWGQRNFLNSITSALPKITQDTVIVLIDDFTGQGSKLAEVLTFLANELEGRKLNPVIKVCVIASMEASKENISSYMELDDYFSSKWLKKGISDNYNGDELEAAKQCMLRLEERLKQTTNFSSFGKGGVEALFGSESNAPNSVFPIFWWRDLKSGIKRRVTLLRRL